MSAKTIVIISTLVDATIREYQPDVDFKIFRTIEGLAQSLEENPIRANTIFFTRDVLGQNVNTSLSYLMNIVENNDFLTVDRIIYITENNSPELVSYNYLVEEYELDNWEVIHGSLSRAFVTEIINGTFREDTFNTKRKAVYRTPRADYVKQQLRNKDSLSEEYIDDDNDLADIPDEEIPTPIQPIREDILKYVYIGGNRCRERTAFALLSAQYLSMSDKTIIVESDNDYHLLSEFATKAEIDAYYISMTEIYEDAYRAVENIRKSDKNLIIVTCIDRISFNYRYTVSMLYYNLLTDLKFFVVESEIDNLPQNNFTTIVVPSTITGILSVGEKVDKSLLPFCNFISVNLNDLPETHVNSGIVVSSILNDILSVNNIICPVVTMSSLRLNGQAYDLGIILGKELLK